MYCLLALAPQWCSTFAWYYYVVNLNWLRVGSQPDKIHGHSKRSGRSSFGPATFRGPNLHHEFLHCVLHCEEANDVTCWLLLHWCDIPSLSLHWNRVYQGDQRETGSRRTQSECLSSHFSLRTQCGKDTGGTNCKNSSATKVLHVYRIAFFCLRVFIRVFTLYARWRAEVPNGR